MWYRYPPRVSSTYIYVTNSSNNDSIARPTVGLKQRELVLLWARSKATPCTPPLWLPWFMVYQSSSPIQGPGFRKLAGSVGGGILLQVSWGCHELTETDIQCGHRYLPGPPLDQAASSPTTIPQQSTISQSPAAMGRRTWEFQCCNCCKPHHQKKSPPTACSIHMQPRSTISPKHISARPCITSNDWILRYMYELWTCLAGLPLRLLRAEETCLCVSSEVHRYCSAVLSVYSVCVSVTLSVVHHADLLID